MEEKEIEESARRILTDLYKGGLIETLYNTKHEYHQNKGWTLKSGAWSPWYFNLRPVGNLPRLVFDIAFVMNHMIRDKAPGVNQLLGIEMAGVPLVAAIGTVRGPGTEFIRYSYTRPLEEKARTPEQAERMLARMKGFEYGGKELVEGRFEDGENICIVDDMVTNFGSKLIAKMILEHELERREVKNCKIEHVAVVLDREAGAEENAKEYGMQLHSLIKFKTKGLDWLKDIMITEEYQLLTQYQADPKRFNGKKERTEAIETAIKYRER